MAVLHLVHRGGHGIRHAARVLRLPKSTVHGWVRQGPKGIRDQRLRGIAARAVDDSVLLTAAEEEEVAEVLRKAVAAAEEPPAGTGCGCCDGCDDSCRGGCCDGCGQPRHTGVMVAFYVPSDVAAGLAMDPAVEPTALPPAELHVTLAYLGKADDLDDPDRLRRVVAGFAAIAPPVDCALSGAGRFSTGDRTVYASVDAPSLPAWRHRLVEHLRLGGYEPSTLHGFTPHVSLCTPDGPVTLDVEPLEFTVRSLSVAIAGARYDYPLEGTSLLLAERSDTPRKPERPDVDERREKDLQEGEERAQAAGARTAENHRRVQGPGEPGSAGQPEAVETAADEYGLLEPPPPPPILDKRALEAWHRYITAVANDVPHSNALHAARRIDEDFMVTDHQAKRLIHALGKGDQPVRFGWSPGSVRPPAHVTGVYEDFEFSEEQTAELADYLFQLARESYLEGLNAQLVQLGRPIETALTDRAVLAQLRERSSQTAYGIADTYANDLAAEVYTTWLEHRSAYGRQSSRRLLWEDVGRWAEARADARADMVSTTEVGRFYNLGVLDFMRRNPALTRQVARVYVMPDECECSRCQELVGDNPYTPEEAMTLNIPVHPRCVHELSVEWEAVDAAGDVGLWTAQESESEAV